ncbi:MAG: phosphate ABC transporter substrate-binding protein PstS [Candidatus Dormibacteria bacterium]
MSAIRRGAAGRIASLLTCMVGGVALASCAGSSPGSTPTGAGGPGGINDLSTPSASLTAAGSTFDQPFFTAAFYEYNQLNSGVTVNYASIGSGGGIAQFQAKTVDFGATDVPMSAAEQAKDTGGPALQVPVALGGEAISYNLSGVSSGLRLTGSVIADIYLGKVTHWNDPEISQLNPSVNLPSEAITVVHRSDGSGTTYIFTDYLSTVSPAWASGPGKGKAINWPVGIGGKGNEGVAGSVKQVPGSIGYVELAYALQNHFTFAEVQNKDGNYVSPSLTTVQTDAAQKPTVSATDFSIVNEPGAQSYPISGYSWVLVYQNQPDASKGTAVVKVLDWLTHDGQQYAKNLDYVPLPANVQQLARTTLMTVTGPSGQTLLS